MKNTAIKGHRTRGSEIIELLEMLGGKNWPYSKYFGNEPTLVYYINDHGYISADEINDSSRCTIYTLEEFLEKFPYKVGDKVLYHDSKAYIKSMEWGSREIIYTVEWEKELWETTVFYLKPYKEETMDKAVFDANAQCCDIMNHLIKQETMEEKLCIGLFPVSNGRKEIIPCDGYEVVSDEGKFYVVKKPPKYPKTYVECCEILYPNENFQTVAQTIKGHNGQKLFALQKLLVCRDAYWKMAGEQMGLGRQWEPNWSDPDEKKYCIVITTEGDIKKCIQKVTHKILTFPTEEMRDEFFKNFKELIKQCKEVL